MGVPIKMLLQYGVFRLKCCCCIVCPDKNAAAIQVVPIKCCCNTGCPHKNAAAIQGVPIKMLLQYGVSR